MDAGQVGSRGVEMPLITLFPHMTHTQTTSLLQVTMHLRTQITGERMTFSSILENVLLVI